MFVVRLTLDGEACSYRTFRSQADAEDFFHREWLNLRGHTDSSGALYRVPGESDDAQAILSIERASQDAELIDLRPL